MIRISSMWLVIITFTLYKTGITTSASEWSYKDQAKWPAECQKGIHQSPIALSEDQAEKTTFNAFNISNYDQLYRATINNNGHTVEIRLTSGGRPSVSGGGLSGPYILDSIHFHWDSEHTINDERFPLEVHLVHFKDQYGSVQKAVQYPDGVAVLGVLFYYSPDDDSELNQVYRAIEDNLIQPRAKINNPQNLRHELELDDFLPRDRAGFYRYRGSLTTPPCAESLIWTVFTNGLPISRKQVDIFTRLRTGRNETLTKNYRPLQELNDRKIQLKISDMEESGASRAIAISSVLPLFIVLFTTLARIDF